MRFPGVAAFSRSQKLRLAGFVSLTILSGAVIFAFARAAQLSSLKRQLADWRVMYLDQEGPTRRANYFYSLSVFLARNRKRLPAISPGKMVWYLGPPDEAEWEGQAGTQLYKFAVSATRNDYLIAQFRDGWLTNMGFLTEPPEPNSAQAAQIDTISPASR